MDIDALRYINSAQICQLLNKYPLGIRIKFGYYIKQWQSSKFEKSSSELNLSTNTVKSSSSSLSESEPLHSFSLDDILTNNTQGSLILNFYKSNNNLNEMCRNLLIDLIISSLLDEKRPMTTSFANHIADVIVGTFPTEIKVINKYTFCITYYFKQFCFTV